MQEFLTSDDIAAALGVSRKTACLIIQSYIPHLRVPRDQYRVTREDFDAFVARQTIDPAAKKK